MFLSLEEKPESEVTIEDLVSNPNSTSVEILGESLALCKCSSVKANSWYAATTPLSWQTSLIDLSALMKEALKSVVLGISCTLEDLGALQMPRCSGPTPKCSDLISLKGSLDTEVFKNLLW